MQSTPLARLDVPDELYEYKELDKPAAATAIRKMVIPMSQKSCFGAITNESLLLFRGDNWLSDDSSMHAMIFIGNAVPKVGLISPNVMGCECEETKQSVISKTQPFQECNDLVLFPLHVNGSHWCGAVFDFKTSPPTIKLYDPQQKEKCLESCENILKALFPEKVSLMSIIHVKSLKQGDGVNCGPLVLHFFECTVRGIALPDSVSTAILRYIRLRYLLKSLHV
eukprot:jgi/Phyca11/132886/e_gw1.251.2.1